MPTYRIDITEATIQRRIAAGHGMGEGESYKPWFFTHEVASHGRSHNPFSYKSNRTLHLISDGELKLFLVGESALKVFENLEQYPLLPREKTVEIADRYKLRHPIHPKTKEPIVLTTDQLWKVSTEEGIEYRPYSFKYSTTRQPSRDARKSNTLENPNVLDKLEIERLFWEENDIRLKIVTEKQIPDAVYANLKQFYAYSQLNIPASQISDIAQALTHKVMTDQLPLHVIAKETDSLFGLTQGESISLQVIWHLLSRHVWEVDITVLIDLSTPLILRQVNMELLGND